MSLEYHVWLVVTTNNNENNELNMRSIYIFVSFFNNFDPSFITTYHTKEYKMIFNLNIVMCFY